MNSDTILRKELLAFLSGGEAHMGFDEAVANFPMDEINRPVPNAGYLVWHVLEHMRVVQWDILDFVMNPNHVSPAFPGGYWPKPDTEATPADWKRIVKAIRTDLKGMEAIVSDAKTDFFNPIPHAKEYNIFREILLVADHNAFHLSEFISIRRILNLNPVKEY